MTTGLTDADLRRIRDEIGDGTPPTDDDLYGLYDDLAGEQGGLAVPWQQVAVSILKRRYAAYMTSGTSASITVPGVIALAGSRQEGLLAPQLLEQIRRLEHAYLGGGGRVGNPYRRGPAWSGWNRNIHVESFTS